MFNFGFRSGKPINRHLKHSEIEIPKSEIILRYYLPGAGGAGGGGGGAKCFGGEQLVHKVAYIAPSNTMLMIFLFIFVVFFFTTYSDAYLFDRFILSSLKKYLPEILLM